ncbi:MAG TPA: hypothetical protein VFQ39_17655, partial [Longimicrobium sp.]|nr:hypothetical protein [Longimicrobium sp.]
EFFPGGSRPVTLEAIVPASQFLTLRDVFTGYTNQNSAGFLVVANQFEAALNANALLRFTGFPDQVSYTQDGSARLDPYAAGPGKVVLKLDSLASAGVAINLQLYRVAQNWDATTASWEMAIDSGAVHTPWTQPGGTRGALVANAVYARTGADSVVFNIDSATVEALRDSASTGLLLASADPNTRVQVTGITLRTVGHPRNATRDTTIAVNVTSGPQTFIFTPAPPQPAGTMQAGGIYSARTIFDLNLDQPLPGCAPPQACAAVRLSDVLLNRVSLLLRPVDVPDGFDPLTRLPITVRTVPEPGLGRRAPLGQSVVDVSSDATRLVYLAKTDTVLDVPITAYAQRIANGDTVPTTFALLSEDVVATSAPPTFGVGVFAGTPRLRIVYTLPVRPRLP